MATHRTRCGVLTCAASLFLLLGCAAEQPPQLALAADAHDAHDAHAVVAGPPYEKVMEMLSAGNARYVDGKLTHPDQTTDRRAEVAKGQHPYAIILCCSDSRVPPEIVFDAGLGDLFVIRVAGNTADDAAIASIEYGVTHLGVSTIVVLGHEKCGAVDAAVKAEGATAPAPGHLGAILNPIKPAVTKVNKAKKQDQSDDETIDQVVWQNVELVVDQLKASKPVLADLVTAGKLTVVGRRYDLDTGKVEAK